MNFKVKFEESQQDFRVGFGEVQTASDGGFERGYAAGYEEGNAEGYTKGHTDGVEQGYAEGIESAQANIVGLVSKTHTKFKNDNILSVGSYAFSECSSLEEVDLPMAETVGNYAFQSSTRLSAVNLPRVKTIGTRAFVNTSSLQRLDLPVCESIGGYCFHGSAKISTLILRSEKVCSLGADAFGTGPIKQGTGFIYVPAALVEQYKSAANWSTYAAQIRAIEDYPEICGIAA